MRRDRSSDLLQDILDFIDRIESWTPPGPELAVEADKKLCTLFFMPCSTLAKPFLGYRAESLSLRPKFPWTKFRAMRNVIAHDYAGIDTAVVWKTVKQRLPEVRTAV